MDGRIEPTLKQVISSAMNRWVRKTIDECDVAFRAVGEIGSLNLGAVYRGQGFSGRTPTGRRMRWALWLKQNNEMYPLAIADSACGGILHDHEDGEIRFADQVLLLNRQGSELVVRRNDSIIGCIHYSRALRWFYFGSGDIVRDGVLFAKLKLPLIGPSLYQVSDSCGRVAIVGQRDIRYLLNPKNEPGLPVTSSQWNDNAFYSHPPLSSTPLFPLEEQQILEQLDVNGRYLLLVAAVWSRMFYTYA